MDFAKPDLSCIIGSYLYGTNVETSDIDYRGFIVPDTEFILGLQEFNQWQSPIEDRVIYSLKTFFRQLQRGNTQFLETLFSNKILDLSNVGLRVLENRQLFVGKQYHRSIRGFAHAEWRKVTATNYQFKPERKSEEDLLTELFGKFNCKSFDRDSIINILYSDKDDPRVALSTTRKLGEARKALVDAHGMDTKSCSHAIRLLGQGIELLKTGGIKFPLTDAAYLLDIKLGKHSLEEVEIEYNRRLAALEVAYQESNLPEKADAKAINKLYIELVKPKLMEI